MQLLKFIVNQNKREGALMRERVSFFPSEQFTRERLSSLFVLTFKRFERRTCATQGIQSQCIRRKEATLLHNQLRITRA